MAFASGRYEQMIVTKGALIVLTDIENEVALWQFLPQGKKKTIADLVTFASGNDIDGTESALSKPPIILKNETNQ